MRNTGSSTNMPSCSSTHTSLTTSSKKLVLHSSKGVFLNTYLFVLDLSWLYFILQITCVLLNLRYCIPYLIFQWWWVAYNRNILPWDILIILYGKIVLICEFDSCGSFHKNELTMQIKNYLYKRNTHKLEKRECMKRVGSSSYITDMH